MSRHDLYEHDSSPNICLVSVTLLQSPQLQQSFLCVGKLGSRVINLGLLFCITFHYSHSKKETH